MRKKHASDILQKLVSHVPKDFQIEKIRFFALLPKMYQTC